MAVHLIYVDDSGNTGNKRDDLDQPFHVAVGVAIRATSWHVIRRDFYAVLQRYEVPTDSPDFEIKGSDLYRGRKLFGGWPQNRRKRLIIGLLAILGRRRIPIICVGVDKKSFPRVQFIPRSLFRYLLWHIGRWSISTRRPSDLVLLIVDENKSIEDEWQYLLQRMREQSEFEMSPEEFALFRRVIGLESANTLAEFRPLLARPVHEAVIDQVHFVQSHDSIGVQLADVCAYIVNQKLRGTDNFNLFPRIEARMEVPLYVFGQE